MNIQDYIKVYENVVDEKLCDLIMSARLDYKSSTFSDHDGTIENSEDRVIMDDFWITDKIEAIYNPLLDCYLKVARLYEEDFPILELKNQRGLELTNMGLVDLCLNTQITFITVTGRNGDFRKYQPCYT